VYWLTELDVSPATIRIASQNLKPMAGRFTAVLLANYNPEATLEAYPQIRVDSFIREQRIMKHLLKVVVVFGLLLLPASAARAQVSFGFSFGTPPPPPRVYRVAPQPAPEYQWVEGYWYPINGRWAWHDGYWSRPPLPESYWVQPYWEGGRYFEGYWDTPRGHFDHDHRWDRNRGRDWNRKWHEHRDHDDRDHDRR
jgi:hypothetical protein